MAKLSIWCLAACFAFACPTGTAAASVVEASQRKCAQPCLATPADAARTFYKAAAKHDLRTARLATVPFRRVPWATDKNGDIGNLRATGNGNGALTNIHVDSVSNELGASEIPTDAHLSQYDKWVNVVVSFDALYRAPSPARDGRQIRFLRMARNAKTKAWLFFSSGTGP